VLRTRRGKRIPPAKVADLADRLAGVETLLSQLIAKEEKPTNPLADNDVEKPEASNSAIDGEGRSANCSFWQALCEEVRLASLSARAMNRIFLYATSMKLTAYATGRRTTRVGIRAFRQPTARIKCIIPPNS
jgi:hypothetical protein